MQADLTDFELIERCLTGGDGAGWEIFVRKYSRLIWSSINKTFRAYAFRFNTEDTEDLCSAVFLSLLENDFYKLRQFSSRDACSLPTWLSVVTVRMTIDFMRKDSSHLFVAATGEDDDILETIRDNRYCAERLFEEKQESRLLSESADSLSDRDRMIFDLLYNRDTSPEEVARIMEMPVEHVYSRKHRITEKLKKNLKDV